MSRAAAAGDVPGGGQGADRVGGCCDAGLELNRRSFLHALGAGLLITVFPGGASAQRRAGPAAPVAARLHLHPDGTVSVLTGKVEEGQGARAELTQAAAEELRVPADRIRLIMADTDLVPDDGITAGSRTTPRTVPAVRRGAAAARELLEKRAAARWQVEPDALVADDGVIAHPPSGRRLTYGELADDPDVASALRQSVPPDVRITALAGWTVMGDSLPRPNARDLVTGHHRYPSDIIRPGMRYGAVLRPPAYRASLESIDLSPGRAMPDVDVIREGDFVAVTAPTSVAARRALRAIGETASWKRAPQVSGDALQTHLQQTARRGDSRARAPVDEALAGAARTLEATYRVAYVQHAPMECRAAAAEWHDGRLTVWTGTDNPFRVRRDLAAAMRVAEDRVRVVVPDFGGGFGGKHTGEAAEEAARLARAVNRPVAVHWTREEEFTWAYFRPAAVIECRAGLDDQGALVAWDFVNINAGGSGLQTPYRVAYRREDSVDADAPLRQGAYRCLGATGSNFARESFMDEVAAAAGSDPLAFRLAHLEDARLRTVLETAAERFDWTSRRPRVSEHRGVGLACGTVKDSVVAACAEVAVDRATGTIRVLEVCQAFECGPIINPVNLRSQVEGCIGMGLGPALWEAIEFEDGRIISDRFSRYRVPRFLDIPRLDIHVIENKEIEPVGAGETPILAVAPAVANAVYAATRVRLRSMPLDTARLVRPVSPA